MMIEVIFKSLLFWEPYRITKPYHIDLFIIFRSLWMGKLSNA